MNIKKIAAIVCAALCATATFALDIETALQKTAEQFSTSIKGGTTIAIIGISSPTLEMSEFMLDEITLDFVRQRKLTVANRANLEAIKTEMNFQLSGEVSDESIQQLGAMIGANVVIHGSLKPLGRNFNLVVQALDVTSATVVDMCRFSIEQNETFKSLLAGTPTPTAKANKKNAAAPKNTATLPEPPKPAVAPPQPQNVQPPQTQKPQPTPPTSDGYTLIDLTGIKPGDVEDNFRVYNRTNIPIQVVVYTPGANNEWVYAASALLKKNSSTDISELGYKKRRPAYYAIRVADASGGSMKFFVNWDTGNDDLRVYVQQSFF